MICYFHASEHTPPSWLLDAPGLACRPVVGGHAWGIGNGWELSKPPSTAVALAGGWLAWVVGKLNPFLLKRKNPVYELSVSLDANEEVWWVPVLLNKRGEKNFVVQYDENWLPVLSQEQQDILSIAKEFSSIAVKAYESTSEDEEVDFVEPKTCAWAAKILSVSNHISPEVIGKLHLLDELLVTGTLLTACCVDPNA